MINRAEFSRTIFCSKKPCAMAAGALGLYLTLIALPGHAAEVGGVQSDDGLGTFHAQNLAITGKGSEKALRLKWEGSDTNDSGRDWHKVTFCVQAFDASDAPIASDRGCLLRLWMYQWKDGAPAVWKGSQKVKVGEDGKYEPTIARLAITVEEARTDAEKRGAVLSNLRSGVAGGAPRVRG